MSAPDEKEMKSYVIQCDTLIEWIAVQERAFNLGYSWHGWGQTVSKIIFSQEHNALWLNGKESLIQYSDYAWYQSEAGLNYVGENCIFATAKMFLNKQIVSEPVPNEGVYF